MRTLKQRYTLAIAAMAVVTPLALYLQYDVPKPSSIGPIRDAIPRVLAEWGAVADRGPSDEEREILETDAILTRTYARGKPPQCDLSVVFAQDNRRVAHPPELCYKGAGWTVESKQVVAVPVDGRPFYVNLLLLLHGEARMWVFYWYKAGPHSCANYFQMQLNIVWCHILNRGSSSALVRLSTICTSPDLDEETLAALREFATVAIPAVSAAIP